MGRDAVHEVAVVSDQDQFALPCPQLLAKPADRNDVKIIRRLVKEKEVRLRDKHLCKVQADLIPSGESEGRFIKIAFREPSPARTFFTL